MIFWFLKNYFNTITHILVAIYLRFKWVFVFLKRYLFENFEMKFPNFFELLRKKNFQTKNYFNAITHCLVAIYLRFKWVFVSLKRTLFKNSKFKKKSKNYLSLSTVKISNCWDDRTISNRIEPNRIESNHIESDRTESNF